MVPGKALESKVYVKILEIPVVWLVKQISLTCFDVLFIHDILS